MTMAVVAVGVAVAGSVAAGFSASETHKSLGRRAISVGEFNSILFDQQSTLVEQNLDIDLAKQERQAQFELAVLDSEIQQKNVDFSTTISDFDRDIALTKREGRRVIADTKAQFGASGVRVQQGSALIQSIVKEMELDESIRELNLQKQRILVETRNEQLFAEFEFKETKKNIIAKRNELMRQETIDQHNLRVNSLKATGAAETSSAQFRATGGAALAQGFVGAAKAIGTGVVIANNSGGSGAGSGEGFTPAPGQVVTSGGTGGP